MLEGVYLNDFVIYNLFWVKIWMGFLIDVKRYICIFFKLLCINMYVVNVELEKNDYKVKYV